MFYVYYRSYTNECYFILLKIEWYTVSDWVPQKGQRKFWEWRISIICLCSKYVKNFQADSEYLGKINTKKKKFNFFFQCLGLPNDPQSFGSQNLRCPSSVSQYYRVQTSEPVSYPHILELQLILYD